MSEQLKWVNIIDFLNDNNTIFSIPFYQRNYEWTKKEVEQLLEDIENLLEETNDNTKHFTGIILDSLINKKSNDNIKEYWIIDGQQRLITLCLLLNAIKVRCKKDNNKSLQYDIETLLMNRYTTDENKIKLKPFGKDREIYDNILNKKNLSKENEFSKISDAYEIVLRAILYHWKEYNVNKIYSALKKLYFVEINLDNEVFDSQKIFESLNSKGLRLADVDLIRNFILMQVDSQQEQMIVFQKWQEIEKTFNDTKILELFFRYFLMLHLRQFISKKSIYIKFKKWLVQTKKESNLYEILEFIKVYAQYYNDIYFTKIENIDEKNQNAIYEYRKLGSGTHIVLIMELYSLLKNEKIESKVFNEIVTLINIYVSRRNIIGLRQISVFFVSMLKNLLEKIDSGELFLDDDIVVFIRGRLVSGKNYMPTDNEIENNLPNIDLSEYKDALKTLHYFFIKYENTDLDRNMLVSRIEYDDYSLKQIIPTSKNDWCRFFNISKQDYLKYTNKCGNFTLIMYQHDTLSDIVDPQTYRKTILKNSKELKLNSEIYDSKYWNIDSINKRTEELIKAFIKLYPYPLENIIQTDNSYLNSLVRENRYMKDSRPTTKTKMPQFKKLIEWNLIKKEDKVYIKGRENSEAIFIDENNVQYKNKLMSPNQYAKQFFKNNIDVYKYICIVGEYETLHKKRIRYMREHEMI